MRAETEMIELILGVAREREEVRAVLMNGSRANPNAPRDILRDFDVVYAVTETGSFTRDLSWLGVFGEELIFQFPSRMDEALYPEEPPASRFTCLLQFTDGNRIDLTLLPLTELDAYLTEDSETLLLLDKDERIKALPSASDRDYWVKRPTEAEYQACCNEFYWLVPYVCKGLWRRELPFALKTQEEFARPMLVKMLSWQVGLAADFSVSTGKCGKYLKNYLDGETMRRFYAAYPAGDYEAAWSALFVLFDLFTDSARLVGDRLGFAFPEGWRENVRGYAAALRELPGDAADLNLPPCR